MGKPPQSPALTRDWESVHGSGFIAHTAPNLEGRGRTSGENQLNIPGWVGRGPSLTRVLKMNCRSVLSDWELVQGSGIQYPYSTSFRGGELQVRIN